MYPPIIHHMKACCYFLTAGEISNIIYMHHKYLFIQSIQRVKNTLYTYNVYVQVFICVHLQQILVYHIYYKL